MFGHEKRGFARGILPEQCRPRFPGRPYTPTRSVPMRVAAHPWSGIGPGPFNFFAFVFSFFFLFSFSVFCFIFLFLSVYFFFCSN
jgi:hypothetical protein